MSASIPKTIFITLKVLLISYFLIAGMIAHWKMPNRNYKILGLLFLYQFLLILISICEFFFEYIPLIFLILVIASASQVYQVYLFLDSCKEYLQPNVLRRNKIILTFYMLIYITLSILTYISGVGARCGGQGRFQVFGPRTYPPCFVLLMIANILFWVFTIIQNYKNYEIDQNLLNLKAEEQINRLKSESQTNNVDQEQTNINSLVQHTLIQSQFQS